MLSIAGAEPALEVDLQRCRADIFDLSANNKPEDLFAVIGSKLYVRSADPHVIALIAPFLRPSRSYDVYLIDLNTDQYEYRMAIATAGETIYIS